MSAYRSGSGQLEEENALLRVECRRVAELEEKVNMVLRNNGQLNAENERLAKMLHQQKGDYEVMRNKYEMINTQRAGLTTNLDFEIKKLLSENEHLKLELAELEKLKNAQVAEARSHLLTELQGIKKQHLSNAELYELEIRKLKDLLERKNYEIEEQRVRLERLFSEAEFDGARAREEKERLRAELGTLDLDRKKEGELIRAKVETYYLTQIEAIKKEHLASLEAIEFENIRLKDQLNIKAQDTESLLLKLQKVKLVADEGSELMRAENDLLSQKLRDFERAHEYESGHLREKLQHAHDFEVELLKGNHANYVDCLRQETSKLEVLLSGKNQEIEQLLREKGQTRHLAETENGRLRLEIEGLSRELAELERSRDLVGLELGSKLAEREEHIQYLNSLSLTQGNKHSQEVDSLRKLLAHKDLEVETTAAQAREVESHLKDSVAALSRESQSLRDEVRRTEAQRSNEQQDLKEQYELQLSQLKEKVEGGSHRTSLARKETDALKENLDLKEKETALMKRRLQASDETERKSSREIEEVRNKLVNKDRDCNKMLEEQRLRLEVRPLSLRRPSTTTWRTPRRTTPTPSSPRS